MQLLKLLFATTLLMLAAAGAFASDADFVLKNKTGYQINEVYVAPSSSKNWRM